MFKKKSDPSISAKYVKGKDSTLDKPSREPRDPWSHLGLAAKIANSITCYRNKKFENADKYYPYNPAARTCDLFFPYAKVNESVMELYLDQPENDDQVASCIEKSQYMRKEGLKYAYIAAEMDIEDVLLQLEA